MAGQGAVGKAEPGVLRLYPDNPARGNHLERSQVKDDEDRRVACYRATRNYVRPCSLMGFPLPQTLHGSGEVPRLPDPLLMAIMPVADG